MKKLVPLAFLIIILGTFISIRLYFQNATGITGAPPYDASGTDYVSESEEESLLRNWKRPEGPAKVGLQVGHWKNEEVPEELNRLRGNTGATGSGKSEWEVNYAIADKTALILRRKGITVELLPATVPKQYVADVFVSIHADGNLDTTKSGFKVATSRRDYTKKAGKLVSLIEENYESATGLANDPNVTRNMRGYYAFSWWRYEHAVHPMTVSAILETGFLTNPFDRQTIVANPHISAEGLSKGIIKYLESEGLLKK